MIHEVVNYAEHLPFRIHSITRKEIMDGYGRRKDVLEHWHRELEIVYAFVADAADYGEWKYGVRSEGLMASSQSIGSKIGIGFGSALTAWILAAVGYVGVPGAEQSQAVISAIRFDYGWLGAILSVALVVAVLFMDVEKYLPQIREELGQKK